MTALTPLNLPDTDLDQFFQALSVPTSEAVKHLHQLQKTPSAWELAQRLLQTASVSCQFYGAHTLQVKLARDWNELPEDHIVPLRDQLLRWILQFSTGPAPVLTKLCLALTTFSLRAVPTYWQNFIPNTLQWLRQEPSNVVGLQGGVSAIDRAILEFLTVIPEEAHQDDISAGRRYQYWDEIRRAAPLVMETCTNLLASAGQPTQGLESPLFGQPNPTLPVGIGTDLQDRTLRTLLRWVQRDLMTDHVASIFDQAVYLFPYPTTCVAAGELISELVTRAEAHGFRKSLCARFLQFVGTPWFQYTLQCILQSGDEEQGRPFCSLLVSFAETFSDDFGQRLGDPSIAPLLQGLIGFTNFPGYFACDQDISDLPLNTWVFIEECYTEQLDSLDEQDETESGMSPSDERRVLQQHAHSLFTQLTQILVSRLEFPPRAQFRDWSSETQDRFLSYRRDVGDALLACYRVLGDSTLRILFANLPSQPSPAVGRTIEAVLYTLRCVSEAVSPHENTHLPLLFQPTFLEVINHPDHLFLRCTWLSFIGSYAEWLNHHPNFLMPALQSVTEAFSGRKEWARAAANAFRALCETCKSQLKHIAGQIIQGVVQVSPNIPQPEKAKALESIAELLPPLDADQFREPFFYLVGNLLSEAVHGLRNAGTIPTDQHRNSVLENLEYMTACSRGLQPTDDDMVRKREHEVSVDCDTVDESTLVPHPGGTPRAPSIGILETRLAAAGSWYALFTSEPFVQFRALRLQLLEEVVVRLEQDEEVVEAVCELLKSTLRQLPSARVHSPSVTLAPSEIASALAVFAFPLSYTNVLQLSPMALATFLVHQNSRWTEHIITLHTQSQGSSMSNEVTKAVSLLTFYLDTVTHLVTVYGNLRKYGGWYQNIRSVIDQLNNPTLLDSMGVRLSPGILTSSTNTVPQLLCALLEEIDALVSPAEAQAMVERLLSHHVDSILRVLQTLDHIEHHPHLLIGFFGFLQKYMQLCPKVLFQTSELQWDALMALTLRCLSFTDRLAVKSAFTYLTDLLTPKTSYSAQIKAFQDQLLQRYGERIIHELLMSLAGRLPRSMLQLPTELLFKLLNGHLEPTRRWLGSALNLPDFPSPHVDSKAKREFLMGIIGKRSYTAVKPPMYKFALQCRNMTEVMYGMY
ncbi:hypothetical protein IWQ62_000977 [Dispira parvispora]|uniref:Importin-13 n=1 Tax=Dispira parvispora TaxID=1520584 RepID=A0A9W8ATM4_9FUNG|nr:hypothetical protein IWQ62_000977 [Dispira parvispora]